MTQISYSEHELLSFGISYSSVNISKFWNLKCGYLFHSIATANIRWSNIYTKLHWIITFSKVLKGWNVAIKWIRWRIIIRWNIDFFDVAWNPFESMSWNFILEMFLWYRRVNLKWMRLKTSRLDLEKYQLFIWCQRLIRFKFVIKSRENASK